MKKLGKWTKYDRDPETIHPRYRGFNVTWMRNEKGEDWYDYQKQLPPGVYALIDDDNRIIQANRDASALAPTRGELVQIKVPGSLSDDEVVLLSGRQVNEDGSVAPAAPPPEPEPDEAGLLIQALLRKGVITKADLKEGRGPPPPAKGPRRGPKSDFARIVADQLDLLDTRVDALQENIASISELLILMDGRLRKLVGHSLSDAKRDKSMAKGQEKLSAEIEELSTKVDEYTSARGREIEEAVQEARDAWEKGTDAAFEAAAARLDEVAKKLTSDNPADPDFDPSANG